MISNDWTGWPYSELQFTAHYKVSLFSLQWPGTANAGYRSHEGRDCCRHTAACSKIWRDDATVSNRPRHRPHSGELETAVEHDHCALPAL